ncbi:DUF6980 family protein [Acidovorax sp. NCPPB 3576]|uniref:DUF6980 family protein n=1 Tax=Acidovorax sp. NCPPB 3576 TaxID=2940488 RepID=UPI00234A0548|nr:hypothetical protein [Acidovorax sp. NCPPB 3576]WCM86431.1 hypothetical protein M5C98_13630 [Acidovorax sp. NCPPB 3576]
MCDQVISDDFNLEFIPKFREYGINYVGGGSYQVIDFCPWCGKKLSSSLREVWFEVLDRIGLEPEDDIPLEMQSEAWWVNDKYKIDKLYLNIGV